MTDLALGIDIGTSGLRSAVVDAAGEVISHARAAHAPQDPGRVDAELWWQATLSCLREQVARLREQGVDPQCIRRIAVDGTSGTMVLMDGDLRPVTRALMYDSGGFDAEAARIGAVAPEPHITRGPGSALARALRLQSEDAAGRAVHLAHQADFLAARLTGRGGLSDENNALKTGFDPGTGDWPGWFAATGLRTALLPEVRPAGAALHPLDATLARDLGLSPDAVIHAGTTDSIAAFLAAAPLRPGVAVTSLGTTLAVKLIAPERIDDPATGLYSHRLGEHWLVGGASNTGGGVLAHHFSPEQLSELSARIDPDARTDLDYYPLLRPGERFPRNAPDLAPRLEPRPPDDAAFLHGMLDGIARIEAECYAVIAARGGPHPHRVLTAGGGAQNAVWTALRARHLGLEPEMARDTEASVGAARLTRLLDAPPPGA